MTTTRGPLRTMLGRLRLVLAVVLLTSMTACPNDTIRLEVHREAALVQAGPSGGALRTIDLEPVRLEFPDPSTFRDSMNGYRIATDDLGEALVRGHYGLHACEVFVSRQSEMVTSSCSRYGTCNEDLIVRGSYYYHVCDDHVITGPDYAEVRIDSRVAVSLLPERQALLLIVKQGDVTVGRASDRVRGGFGVPQRVPPDTFWFTTQDGRSIAGLEPNVVYPLGAIEPVLRELDLEAFVARVNDRFGVRLDEPTPVRVGVLPPLFAVFDDPALAVVPTGPADLVVPLFEATGPVVALGAGDFELPVRFAVRNRGGATAPPFKVSVEVANATTAFTVPFVTPSGTVLWYPETEGPMAPGATVTFDLTVHLPDVLRGSTVELRLTADSCAGDEFMPPYCRVEESDETNNSARLLVQVPVRLGVP